MYITDFSIVKLIANMNKHNYAIKPTVSCISLQLISVIIRDCYRSVLKLLKIPLATNIDLIFY